MYKKDCLELFVLNGVWEGCWSWILSFCFKEKKYKSKIKITCGCCYLIKVEYQCLIWIGEGGGVTSNKRH